MLHLRHVCFDGAASPAVTSPRRSLRGSRARPALEETEPDAFLAWLLERAGLDHRAYRGSALQRRLPACLRQLRVPTGEAARALLERRPELLPFAVGTVLIGVSHFFRDTAVFDGLAREALPALLRTGGRLRICSLGCSRGQELYSIAMLLAEAGALGRCELLGLDCRDEAVAAAERGVYTDGEVAMVAPARRQRFFEPVNGHWAIKPELRRATRWMRGDLFAPRGETWDLLLCRNVMIYLRPATAERVWAGLRERLAPGGFLVTGKAEKPPASAPFLRVAPSLFLRCS